MISRILLAFKNAFSGLFQALKSERNFKIQISLAFLAIGLGLFYQITKYEWALILMCIGMVLSAELFNSSIEHICNMVQPQYDLRVKKIKDFAASAVLILALMSLIIALIVFLPYIKN